jgi:hypothetical protein
MLKKKCKYQGCDRNSRAKNLCHKHYCEVLGKTDKYRIMKQDYYLRNKDRIKDYRVSKKSDIVQRYYRGKGEVKRRDRNFSITLEEYRNIMTNVCHYCDNIVNTGLALDRKDNNKDYTIDNVVVCCNRCNTLKRDLLSYEEMLKLVTMLKQSRNNNNIWSKNGTED